MSDVWTALSSSATRVAPAFAELTETVEPDRKTMVTPEVPFFDVTGDGRIGRVKIFIQTRAG